MADLRQYAGNAVPTGYSPGRVCTVSFGQKSLQGSLLVLVAVSSHEDDRSYPLLAPGWGTPAVYRTQDEIDLAIWYVQNAPAISSTQVINTSNRSVQARLLELTGAAQSNALDRIAVANARTSLPRSGQTATASQADEIVIAAIANRYPSTNQGGFSGGMAMLSNTATPDGAPGDSDDQRSRLSVHLALPSTAAAWQIQGQLTTSRDWIAAVVTFRGGTSGPARMTSVDQPAVLDTSGGSGDLSLFGPLVSTDQPAVLDTVGGSGLIGPFELQLRLGGWDGLLIGAGTDYRVGAIEGLGGWDVRTSDGEFPRGDGAQRGIDLQSARTIVLDLNWDHPDRATLEQRTRTLMAALLPRRIADAELLFRLPGLPMQMLRYRPITLARELDAVQMLLRSQKVALRAADPRIYGAQDRSVEIPNTPANATAVTAVSAVNAGNSDAYPVVRFDNRGSVEITELALVNVTTDVAFEAAGVIPPGGQLVGDMPAHVTAAPRAVVTLDGQSAYAIWQPPREPLRLAAGVNALYLTTVPAGASVSCRIEYRDTSAG